MPINGPGTECYKGTDCPDDQVCDANKCNTCKKGSNPDEDREKCEPTSMFHYFFFYNHQR